MIDDDGNKLWAIDYIKDSKRTRGGGFQYLIKWKDTDESTWQPLTDVVDSWASIKEFESRHKKKLKPTKLEIERARLASQLVKESE
jgi:hypothetical protein